LPPAGAEGSNLGLLQSVKYKCFHNKSVALQDPSLI
jgi:hypothetical protein